MIYLFFRKRWKKQIQFQWNKRTKKKRNNITFYGSRERTKVPPEMSSVVKKHPFSVSWKPHCSSSTLEPWHPWRASTRFAGRLQKLPALYLCTKQSLSLTHGVSHSHSASSVFRQPCTHSSPSSHDFSLNTKRQAKSQAKSEQQPVLHPPDRFPSPSLSSCNEGWATRCPPPLLLIYSQVP